jgi:chemotaxis protein CheY-P-specific phosphatase CheC
MKNSFNFTEDQRDYLQEICNIGMGQAGKSLSVLFEQYVTLSVPSIEIFSATNLMSTLKRLIPAEKISAVRQGFYTHVVDPNICGESITIFSNTDVEQLAQLIDLNQEVTFEMEQEILLEISNIINGACLSGIAGQISERFFNTPPSIIGQSIIIESLLNKEHLMWDYALSIKIQYSVEQHSFQCDLLLLMPDSSVKYLQDVLNRLFDEL